MTGPITGPEVLSTAADLCIKVGNLVDASVYKQGVRDLVAKLLYPELTDAAAQEMAGTRIREVIRNRAPRRIAAYTPHAFEMTRHWPYSVCAECGCRIGATHHI